MNPVRQDVLDATSPFIGGTVLTGMTCSALTAGVMALGVALGEIERSRLRVLRMIGTMAAGGNAFANDLNKFNGVMNLGHELANWFSGKCGSTQCRDITGCNFSTTDGVNQYIETGGVSRCQALAQQVAVKVDRMIDSVRCQGDAGPRQQLRPSFNACEAAFPQDTRSKRTSSNAC